MRAYLQILVAAAALAAGCLIAANVIIDPYRIVHPAIGKLTFQPNSRVYKFDYLSAHCREYDAYFVGDSRSHILTAQDLNDVGGLRFYNLAAPRDEITSIVPRLKFLMDEGCPIAAIVAGESIDIVSDGKDDSLLNTESPLMSGEGRLRFAGKFVFSSQPLIDDLGQRIFGSPYHFLYYPDGHVEYLWRMQGAADLAAPSCRPPELPDAAKQLLFAKLTAYRQLAELSLRNHFRVVVWITPFNYWKQRIYDDPDVKRYLSELRSIPNLSVVDADRSSPMLADFRLWTDCLHYRHPVFDALVAPRIISLLSRR